MSTGETEEAQSGHEDGGGGGPGAPTPLSALEVLQISPYTGQQRVLISDRGLEGSLLVTSSSSSKGASIPLNLSHIRGSPSKLKSQSMPDILPGREEC